jgi:hypothetical protein
MVGPASLSHHAEGISMLDMNSGAYWYRNPGARSNIHPITGSEMNP